MLEEARGQNPSNALVIITTASPRRLAEFEEMLHEAPFTSIQQHPLPPGVSTTSLRPRLINPNPQRVALTSAC